MTFHCRLVETEQNASQKAYEIVLSKKDKEYSHSGLINLCAGIDYHLQNNPYKWSIDLMNDQAFLQANKVFTGKLRDSKEKGLDVSKKRTSTDQQDMQYLFRNYFIQCIQANDTQVLLQKVFFDIVYYTGRWGKGGLRNPTKSSFEIKTGVDGSEFIQLIFNEKTKKNQGDKTSSGLDALHNDQYIISVQEDKTLCLVKSFKTYLSMLNPNYNAFFQYHSADKKNWQENCR